MHTTTSNKRIRDQRRRDSEDVSVWMFVHCSFSRLVIVFNKPFASMTNTFLKRSELEVRQVATKLRVVGSLLELTIRFRSVPLNLAWDRKEKARRRRMTIQSSRFMHVSEKRIQTMEVHCFHNQVNDLSNGDFRCRINRENNRINFIVGTQHPQHQSSQITRINKLA